MSAHAMLTHGMSFHGMSAHAMSVHGMSAGVADFFGSETDLYPGWKKNSDQTYSCPRD